MIHACMHGAKVTCSRRVFLFLLQIAIVYIFLICRPMVGSLLRETERQHSGRPKAPASRFFHFLINVGCSFFSSLALFFVLV